MKHLNLSLVIRNRQKICRHLLVIVTALLPTPVLASESHILYDKKGVDVIASDASQTISYIKEQGSKDLYCAGTGSDFAGYSGKGFNLGGKDAIGGGGIGFSNSHGVQSFGGRTPLVLITREMMFRACELSLNTNSDREQSIEIYKLFLETLKDLGGDQQISGTSAASSAAIQKSEPSQEDESTNGSDDDSFETN